MVVADAEMHHGADGDGVVAVFVGDDDGLLDDSADAHDGDLRLVDDRHAELGSKDAWVGDGEGATLHFVGLELLGAGALAEVADGALQSDEAALLGVLDHGNDQSPVEGYRDAEVDGRVVADVVAFHRRIDDGELAQSVNRGAREERREGQLAAGRLLELPFHLFAQLDDAGDVDFEDSVHVGAGALRHQHVLGNLLAHGAHGHEFAGSDTSDGLERRGDRRSGRGFVARCRRGGCWPGSGRCGRRGSAGVLGDECLDIILGDAAAESGAGNARQVDIVVFRNFADERAGTDAALVAVLGLGFGLLRGGRRSSGGWRLGLFSRRRLSSLRGGGSYCCLGLRGSRSSGSVTVSDDADYGVDLYGVAGCDLDLLQSAGRGGGDFGVNLVGRDFEQGLVALNFVAGLLEPLGDGSFEDRFPHLGHNYVSRHGFLPRRRWVEIKVKRKWRLYRVEGVCRFSGTRVELRREIACSRRGMTVSWWARNHHSTAKERICLRNTRSGIAL